MTFRSVDLGPKACACANNSGLCQVRTPAFHRATLFRPDRQSEGAQPVRAGLATSRLPLVIINHGTDDATRLSLAMPVYYWLSRWFVDRGYAVLCPSGAATARPAARSRRRLAPATIPIITIRPGAARDLSATIAFMKEQHSSIGSMSSSLAFPQVDGRRWRWRR